MKPPQSNHVDTTDETSSIWLVGLVYTCSEAWGQPCWVGPQNRISIRPGETGRIAYNREFGVELPSSDTVFFIDA